jgi:AcrR family transcriptional regulator
MSTQRTLSPEPLEMIASASRRPGPSDGRRATNRRRREDTLRQEALRLFGERGLEAVAVEDIAAAAGMSKSNFYRYAANKDELVVALFAPFKDAIFAAFDRCDAACMRATEPRELTAAYMALAFELLKLVEAEREVVMLFLQEARGPDHGARMPIRALERELLARSVSLTEIAHRHGTLRKIPATVSAFIVVGAVERLLLAYLRDGVFRNAGEVVQALVRLVMEGITG